MTPTRQRQPAPRRTVHQILPGDQITAYQAITDAENHRSLFRRSQHSRMGHQISRRLLLP